jgi:predicted ATPase
MDRIEIQGFKSIKDLTLKLKPINILIGANGSGKSNFLSFFDFLNQIYENKLKEYININIEKILHKGSKITNEIYSKIVFSRNAYSFKINKADNSFFFEEEGIWFDGSKFDIASYSEI